MDNFMGDRLWEIQIVLYSLGQLGNLDRIVSNHRSVWCLTCSYVLSVRDGPC